MRVLPLIVAGVFLCTCTQRPPLIQQILDLGELRVVTRNGATAYYEGSDGPTGPEYDLAGLFAERLGVSLMMYTRDGFAEILAEVTEGRAHLAAAGLTATKDRREYVAFGPPYQQVKQQLVYRLGTRRPRGIQDLVGAHIEVIADSSHAETLHEIRQGIPELAWVESPNLESAGLLQRLANEEIQFAVTDSTDFAIARNYHPEIRVALDLSEPESLAWAFARDNDDSLLDLAADFFDDLRESGELDVIAHRYYGHTRKFDYVGTRSFLRHVDTRLPRYRTWFEEAAETHEEDWRLLAAIGYQESHWRASAVSPTGVRGIMMLTQATARQVGIRNRINAKDSIFGGARYFTEIKRRLRDIAEPDRTWFALAAYNVGLGHLEDARLLTQRDGRDPDKWIDVREYLPLLAQKKWHSQTKHGYARGWEPVKYVSNIRGYYDILQWITTEGREEEKPRESEKNPEFNRPTTIAVSTT